MPLIPATGDNFKKIVIQNTGSAVVADTISDTLTLIGGAGITITANEAGDSITLAAAATLNTAGLDDILNNGNTSTFGITVASATIDDTVINGNSVTVNHASNNLTLSTTGTGTINIGRTMNVKDILPVADILYDLGSPSYRFRDLYLSGSSIKLGSATITSTGTSINLPAGTTVGGNSFIDDVIPTQTGQVDKFLRTNGSTLYWATIPDQFPTRTGNNGKFLFTDGSTVSWSLINDYVAGDIPYAVTFKNNVIVEGTLTTKQTVTIESTSVSVADKNIELGVTTTPTNITADGGGITLKGATDKTITWINSTGRWTSNQPFEATSFHGNLTGDVTGNVSGTVTNGVVTTGSYSDPSWLTISATKVGLGNVTNESKATMFTDPTFTGTVSGITASMVGLGNVTNESKATMFTDPTFTGTVSGITASMVGLGNVTNESKATMFASPTFTGTVSGVTATMVGLGNVTNESKATMFASPTFTGTVSLPVISEVVTALTSATGTVTHDTSLSSVFYHTGISSNFTANFTNVPTTNNRVLTYAVVLIQGSTAYIPNALQIDGTAQTINWSANTTPVGTSSRTDIVIFQLFRVGSSWRVVGSLGSY